MHLFDIIGPNPLGLPEGEVVLEDVNAGEMLSRGWGRVRDASGIREKLFDAKLDWNGKRILFVRPGGFGDLLFLTPTFAELKRRWPTIKIFVACFDRFKGALENNPDIAEFAPYPVPLVTWDLFDAHVWLEGIIETNSKALTTHAVDLIAERVFGFSDVWRVTSDEQKRMRYFVTDAERAAAEDEFPKRDDVKRVGFQMSASGKCRMYPHMLEVSTQLWRTHKCEIFLFGRPGDRKSNEFPLSAPGSGDPPGIVNLMMRGKSFRESCALLATCDAVVAPDSALVHVAGALHKLCADLDSAPALNPVGPLRRPSSLLNDWEYCPVPCVALYGPFPWDLRTKYAPETFAIQGVGDCAPCFFHQRPGTGEFPENGPCRQTGRCEVLAAIPAERVVREVLKKLEGSSAPTLSPVAALRRGSSLLDD